MSDDFHAENSDVTEIAIETEEAAGPLTQLNEFKETGPDGWWSAMIAMPVFGACLFGTCWMMESVLGNQGQGAPIVLLVLIHLVPVVIGLATVAQLRRWFLKRLNSPVGCSVSRAIRFLGSMLTLLCFLLGLVLSFKSGRPHEGQLLVLVCWFALAVLMGLFPRGELK